MAAQFTTQTSQTLSAGQDNVNWAYNHPKNKKVTFNGNARESL